VNRETTRIALAFASVPNAGPVLFKRCLERFGDAAGVSGASAEALASIEGMPRAFAGAWRDKKEFLERADREMDLAESRGIQILTPFDDGYPSLLRTIYDPPIALYVKGRLAPLEQRVAVVGSREASSYGLSTASAFARDFAAAGLVVVSGLARGIDSAAHRGALEAGGVTWAVLGGGLLHSGSYRAQQLADQMIEKGAVISEFPLNTAPRPEFYPRRNRIVSGLSQAVVVIEAGPQSGALITSGLALEQGRDVFAVPGPVDSTGAEGSNWLLRQGAKFVRSAADVLEDLGYAGGSSAPVFAAADLTESERRMIDALTPRQPLHLDEWIEQSGRSSAEALAVIGSLLLKGAVSEKPGKFYARGNPLR
jgi:DNA processing protein